MWACSVRKKIENKKIEKQKVNKKNNNKKGEGKPLTDFRSEFQAAKRLGTACRAPKRVALQNGVDNLLAGTDVVAERQRSTKYRENDDDLSDRVVSSGQRSSAQKVMMQLRVTWKQRRSTTILCNAHVVGVSSVPAIHSERWLSFQRHDQTRWSKCFDGASREVKQFLPTRNLVSWNSAAKKKMKEGK